MIDAKFVFGTQYSTTVFPKKKKCRGHYSTIYHDTSQWVMRSDTHLSFWHNIKKSAFEDQNHANYM